MLRSAIISGKVTCLVVPGRCFHRFLLLFEGQRSYFWNYRYPFLNIGKKLSQFWNGPTELGREPCLGKISLGKTKFGKENFGDHVLEILVPKLSNTYKSFQLLVNFFQLLVTFFQLLVIFFPTL